MKTFLPSIFFLFLIVSCSKQVTISEDQYPDDTFFQSDNVTPYTGKCVVLYSGSEKVKEEMYFEQGILNGAWISYHKNGNIERKGEFLDGLFHGKWESWSAEGRKLYEVIYKNDTLSGKYITWYESGKLKEKGEYSANVKTGNWVSYDESGEIIKKYNNSIN